MPVRVRFTLAPLVLLVITACGASDAGGPSAVTEAADIKVEVDVMSGVPNPTWTVSGSDAAVLVELINALPENGDIDVSGDLGLGFRGFVLRGLELPGDADQVRVMGSQVVVSRGHAIGKLSGTDEDREIYTMLRTMSEEHLNENVLQAIPVDGLKGS